MIVNQTKYRNPNAEKHIGDLLCYETNSLLRGRSKFKAKHLDGVITLSTGEQFGDSVLNDNGRSHISKHLTEFLKLNVGINWQGSAFTFKEIPFQIKRTASEILAAARNEEWYAEALLCAYGDYSIIRNGWIAGISLSNTTDEISEYSYSTRHCIHKGFLEDRYSMVAGLSRVSDDYKWLITRLRDTGFGDIKFYEPWVCCFTELMPDVVLENLLQNYENHYLPNKETLDAKGYSHQSRQDSADISSHDEPV